ncbi:MAG TPA: iron-containing redox enzyme family protein [Pyrinomonadaceae bacterium]|nr:iron-containing redox enzyme family protein [Pyrinomonadaceae bacterium]
MSCEFEEQLLATASRFDNASHPFARGVRDGIYPRAGLHLYATELAAVVSAFSRSLAAIFARCDDAEVRRMLLENLLEEEGAVSFRPNDGLVVDPRRRHSDLARRFARAAGAVEDDAHGRVKIPTWFIRELGEDRWIGPLAYVVIGYEANIPPMFRALLEGFRHHYHFTEEELAFFTEHTVADVRHSAQGAAIIAAAARDPVAQREALDGARRGASVWWQFHLRHHRALRSLVMA